MRFTLSFTLLSFVAIAAASVQVPDASQVGALPAFLQLSSLVKAGSKDENVLSNYKELGQQLHSEGTDLTKVLGTDQVVDSLFHVLGLDSLLKKRDTAIPNAEEIGTLPAFLQLSALVKAGSEDPEVLQSYKKLGKQLKSEGTQFHKVLGTKQEATPLFELLGINKRDEEVVSEERSVASAGDLPDFLVLVNKLLSDDASSSSSDESDIKLFISLGKKLRKEGTDISKIIGSSFKGKAFAEMFDDKENGVANGVADVEKADQILSGRAHLAHGHAAMQRRRSSGIEHL